MYDDTVKGKTHRGLAFESTDKQKQCNTIQEVMIMLKKLFEALKILKKENHSKAANDYEKKFGCYTAGYRH